MKILLVDDEPVVRRALKMMIQNEGFPFEVVLEAGTGQEAVLLVEQHHPEVILLDIKMPGLDGISAAKKIKTITPQCNIVFLTAYAKFDYAQAAIRCNARDYLVKPVNQDELRLIIADCIGEIVPPIHLSHIQRILKTTVEYILENFAKPLTLEAIAQQVHLSPAYFSSLFKREQGQTLTEFLTQVRLEKAKELLRGNPSLSIYEISKQVGYEDANYFSRIFKKKMGISPIAYRNTPGGC